MDNLNTNREASLYEAFPPEKARALCERFEMHCTPKHGSWLNMAEIEIGLLGRTCLDRRIGWAVEFGTEVAAYLELEKCKRKTHQLAVHQRRGTDQTKINLSDNLDFTQH